MHKRSVVGLTMYVGTAQDISCRALLVSLERNYFDLLMRTPIPNPYEKTVRIYNVCKN